MTGVRGAQGEEMERRGEGGVGEGFGLRRGVLARLIMMRTMRTSIVG